MVSPWQADGPPSTGSGGQVQAPPPHAAQRGGGGKKGKKKKLANPDTLGLPYVVCPSCRTWVHTHKLAATEGWCRKCDSSWLGDLFVQHPPGSEEVDPWGGGYEDEDEHEVDPAGDDPWFGEVAEANQIAEAEQNQEEQEEEMEEEHPQGAPSEAKGSKGAGKAKSGKIGAAAATVAKSGSLRPKAPSDEFPRRGVWRHPVVALRPRSPRGPPPRASPGSEDPARPWQ